MRRGTTNARPRTPATTVAALATALAVLAATVVGGGAAGAAGPFSDVPEDHPFVVDIQWLVAEGITQGYLDGTFRPAEPITRQAMAAFLYRTAGQPSGPDPACIEDAFPDVPMAHPFCGEVAWLAGTGITTGYLDGNFRPAEPITRQAMAAFLYRFADEPEGEEPACPVGPFVDVSTAHLFCGEIRWLASTGITTGYPGGLFKPSDPITRQAMAAFLHRYDLWANPTEGPFRLVSHTPAGVGAGVYSGDSDVSDDGRFVVFTSYSEELEGGDGSTSQVYLWDRDDDSVTLVSRTPGGQAGDDDSEAPRISGDGTVVVFHTGADNLPGAAANGDDVYHYEVATGTLTNLTGPVGGGFRSRDADLSADGSIVVFSAAQEILPADTYDGFDIYQWIDGPAAGAGDGTFALVSTGSDGHSERPVVDAAGITVAFESRTSTWGGNGDLEVFVADLDEGVAITPVSSTADDGANDYGPAISADGRGVCFFHDALDDADSGLMVRDLDDGPAIKINQGAETCAMGADADAVVGAVDQPLVPADVNVEPDLYLWERGTGTHTLLTANPLTGKSANGESFTGAITPDLRYLAFETEATDLAPGRETTGGWDVVLLDRGPG